MAKKKQEFKFIINTPPDEEIINEFHRSLAESLISKFGENTMKEVVRQMQEKSSINKQ